MRAFRFAAVLWTIIAFGVSAYLFFVEADAFDSVAGQLFTLGVAYRGFAIANAIVAILVLLHPRGWTGILATLVALAGAALVFTTAISAVALPLGLPPLPYDPTWTLDRVVLAAAQVFGVLGGLLVAARRR